MRDEWMCMKRRGKYNERKEPTYSGKSLFQWYFIHRNYHLDSPDIEYEPPSWKVDIYPTWDMGGCTGLLMWIVFLSEDINNSGWFKGF
jgi:hypothetical protein